MANEPAGRLNPAAQRQFAQSGREVDFFVFVVCSDRGQHESVLLTTARRELDGTHGMNHALRYFAPPSRDDEFPELSRESYVFRCPRCSRTPRIKRDRWWSLIDELGRQEQTTLDLSLLPL